MAPTTGAAKAAIEDFFRGRLGPRVLHPEVRDAMAAYFVSKGLTLPGLPTARPATPESVMEWCAEWRDYARFAMLADDADINNVYQWLAEDTSPVEGELRAGKAMAVADALVKQGIVINRAAELAIDAAIAAADKGDADAQCRHVVVVFQLYWGQSPGEEDQKEFLEKRAACNAVDR